MPDKDNFGAVLQPVGFCWQNNDLGLKQDSVIAALRSSAGNSGFHEMNHPVVLARDNAAHAAVAFTPGNLARGAWPSPNAEVAPTQKCSAGRGADDQRTCVAFPINTLTLGGRPDAVNDKRMTMGVGENGDPQFTLQAAHGHAVAFNWQNGGGYGNANEGLGITIEGTGPIQRCNTPAVAHTMTVRRLTPRECERLQAFPDDYTLIPWRRKPAAECPDGPRYKALGNSMAVNCMAWIGERIAAVEANEPTGPRGLAAAAAELMERGGSGT